MAECITVEEQDNLAGNTAMVRRNRRIGTAADARFAWTAPSEVHTIVPLQSNAVAVARRHARS